MFTIVSLVFAIGFSLFLLSGAVAAIRLRAQPTAPLPVVGFSAVSLITAGLYLAAFMLGGA